jgi:hypothetical protein
VNNNNMRYGWSLDKEQWQTLIRTTATITWSRVHLRDLDRDSIPERPGVYVICAKVKGFGQGVFSELYNVIYAGQDGVSLRRRFLEHCGKPKVELRSAQNCYIYPLEYWYSVVEVEQLDEIEGALIDCLGPPANLVRKLTIKARLGRPQPAGAE